MDNITIIVPESSPDIAVTTVKEMVIRIPGEPGISAYEIAKLEGFEGTMAEWVLSLKGNSGLSAYDVWISQGNEGSVEDYILSLKGEDCILTADDKKEIAGLVEGFATQEYVDTEAEKTLSAARTFTTQEIEKIPTQGVNCDIVTHNESVLSHPSLNKSINDALVRFNEFLGEGIGEFPLDDTSEFSGITYVEMITAYFNLMQAHIEVVNKLSDLSANEISYKEQTQSQFNESVEADIAQLKTSINKI